MNKLKFYTYNYKNVEYFTHDDKSTLHMLSRLYMQINVLNDRFNILNDTSEYNLLSRNDDINVIWGDKNISFEECCINRTNEIINYSEISNLDIYVAYSGGVDSTCVVCSFLMNPRLDKERFHVLYNKHSIDEYPYFFELMVRNKISVIDIETDIQNLINISENGIIVSGLCGDQLDGSDLITKKYYRKTDYFDFWKDGLIKCSDIKVSDRHISDIEDYIKYTGLNIKYFGDFAWLFNFCIKWSYVSEYMGVFMKNKYYAFFDTLEFSRYALYNMSKEYKKKQLGYSYKTDFKKIIHKYTKDDYYFVYKGKEAIYIGSKTASPGFLLVNDVNKFIIKDTSSKIIYDMLIPYIKPCYKEYFVVENVRVR